LLLVSRTLGEQHAAVALDHGGDNGKWR
jgi:hypothetical protein